MTAPEGSFDSVEIAAAMRDLIRQISNAEFERQNVKKRIGRVLRMDYASRNAVVWFPGDSDPVTVKFFTSTIPGDWQELYASDATNTSTEGFGSIVAVETIQDSQWITSVLTGGQFSGDFQVAGVQDIAYNRFGDPAYPASGDYVYQTAWTDREGNAVGGDVGGPLAINIGPFLPYNYGYPTNANHEIEIVAQDGKAQRYSFSMDSYYQMFAGTSGGTNPQNDRWFRVIPYQTADDNSANNYDIRVNESYNWDLSGDEGGWQGYTNTSLTPSEDFQHAGSTGALLIQSTDALQDGIGMHTYPYGLNPVAEGGAYKFTFYIMTPDGNYANNVEARIEWLDYDSVLISDVVGTGAGLVDDAWTQFTVEGIAPLGAVSALAVVYINGVPGTSRRFYVDDAQLRSMDSTSKTDFALDVAIRQTLHGSTSGSTIIDSGGELWIRIYIFWKTYRSSQFTVRVKNTGGWHAAKSTQTKKPVYEHESIPTNAVGYLGYHDAGTPYTTSTAAMANRPYREPSNGPWRNPELLLGQRAQLVMSFAGGPFYDSAEGTFGWTDAIVVGGIGRSRNYMMTPWVDLFQPTSGAIPVWPGGSTVTAQAEGVPLGDNQSLWFAIPIGTNTNIPAQNYYDSGTNGTGGLFIVDHNENTESWIPPEWAVLLAWRLPDGLAVNANGRIKLGDGSYCDGPTASTQVFPTSNGSGSSTYVTLSTGGVCGITFVAPRSGKVDLKWSATMAGSLAATNCWASVEVREGDTIGSGTVIDSPSDDDAVRIGGTAGGRASEFMVLTGLTPGADYNVQMYHKQSGGGTATFLNRKLAAVPIA